MAIHKCRTCGAAASNSWWCPPCKAKQQPEKKPKAGARALSTTERGLGAEHQKARRAALKAHRGGDPCGHCGHPMYVDQGLDLDHQVPRALGGEHGPRHLAHAWCNRSAGGRLSGALRRAARAAAAQPATTSTEPNTEIGCTYCGRPSCRHSLGYTSRCW